MGLVAEHPYKIVSTGKPKTEIRVGTKPNVMTTKDIVEKRKDITLTATAEASQGKFCEIWPQARTGLELLQGLIKNPIAKGAIGLVIGAGDAVSKSVCGSPTT